MDENFPAIRKNLNILSVLILILAFSNAQIDKINFLGLQLELEGKRLYIGLYVIYTYFIWRYFTKLPYNEFMNGFHTFLIQAKDGMLNKFPFEKYKDEFLDASSHLAEHFQDGRASLFRMSLRRSNAKSLREYDVICDYVFEQTPEERKGSQSNMEKSEIKKKVSRWLLTRKFLWFCIKYDKFGDYIFPLIPIIAIILFFFLNSDWQGSFTQLFFE